MLVWKQACRLSFPYLSTELNFVSSTGASGAPRKASGDCLEFSALQWATLVVPLRTQHMNRFVLCIRALPYLHDGSDYKEQFCEFSGQAASRV